MSKACKIKLQNFEGPFDLLFHLIEKNKLNIYDIPINDITHQYMDYLFAMQEMDLEIASEFLVMASTLLHIKSKMLLPDKKEELGEEEQLDPREELVLRLIEYKRYKDFSKILKEREQEWAKVFYKFPEIIEIEENEMLIDLSPEDLKNTYARIVERNKLKVNKNVEKGMEKIIQKEKVSLKSKMKEILKSILDSGKMLFAEIFSLKTKSRTEVVTGFLAMLELAKLKRISISQQQQFSDIVLNKLGDADDTLEDEKIGFKS